MPQKVKIHVNVAVALPVKETYTYAVPDQWESEAQIGRRVLVPFKNREATGYILEEITGEDTRVLKEIKKILDPEPLFHEGLVPFLKWMAEYYLHPLGRLIESALPSGLNVSQYRTARLTDEGQRILDLLPPAAMEKTALQWVKQNPGKRLPSSFTPAESFVRKGWMIVEKQERRKRVGPLIRKYVRIKQGLGRDSVLGGASGEYKAKNEFIFLEALFESDGIPLRDISSRFSNGLYLVNKWARKGVVERYEKAVYRDPAGRPIQPSPIPEKLFDQQEAVLAQIRRRLERGAFSTCLLHGVTGSGKTEVYYRAIEETIDMGRKTILMVPEIALAIYMEGLFRSRLGDRVAIYHSGLSAGERYDEWMRMVRGEIDLVIGARSALFAPVPHLGLIIVDEEHDYSYKQEEGARHQARDAAVVRGKTGQALVILGSGTPSIQSFHNASKKRYHLLTMPERIEKRPLPKVQVVDMKEAVGTGNQNGILSPMLKEALDENLTAKRQAILFLNRRGFNRVSLCRYCGESLKCYNCDLSLIYHFKDNCLSCHYCGFHASPRETCPSCGKKGVTSYGFGTERLEQELKTLYPERHITRMDRDSIRRKGQIFKILKQFVEQKIDILVGTQMITKGYDFPNVTLVGVIAADLSLAFPDFRASERTFQLLSQVAGRAGRGDHAGRVIVQTFNPEHYAISTARNHDYQSFYKGEKELREQLGYPPFSYLASLRFQGNNQRKTVKMAEVMGQRILGILKNWPKRGKDIQVLGPAEAPLAKLRGKYRWQILLKGKGSGVLHYLLREVEGFSRGILRGTGVSMIIDVDPYQML